MADELRVDCNRDLRTEPRGCGDVSRAGSASADDVDAELIDNDLDADLDTRGARGARDAVDAVEAVEAVDVELHRRRGLAMSNGKRASTALHAATKPAAAARSSSVDPVSAALRQFVHDSVDSIELLDVLVLLRRDADVAWTVASIAAELRIQPRSANARVNALRALGLVRDVEGGFTFNPSSSLLEVVDELVSAYQTRRVRVIEMIFTKPATHGKTP